MHCSGGGGGGGSEFVDSLVGVVIGCGANGDRCDGSGGVLWVAWCGVRWWCYGTLLFMMVVAGDGVLMLVK